jgi:hypothetical protein
MVAFRAPTRLLLALVAGGLAACTPDPGEGSQNGSAPDAPAGAPAPATDLVGTWVLDAGTQEWLPRACVVLDFDVPEQASFELSHQGGHLFVRLGTPTHTTWRSPARSRVFQGQQVLPTTQAGRFCGRETAVRLRLWATSPDTLVGVWKTPGCDVCPDRHFGATRAGD